MELTEQDKWQAVKHRLVEMIACCNDLEATINDMKDLKPSLTWKESWILGIQEMKIHLIDMDKVAGLNIKIAKDNLL